MTPHLGTRVSALLDGQLSTDETERAWAHVHLCHLCRDHVEREGWIKTRLAGTSFEPGPAPDTLKGALLGMSPVGMSPVGMSPGDLYLTLSAEADHARGRGRRAVGVAAIGGSAVGAAVMGILALGTAPADAPGLDRRAPIAQVTTPQPTMVRTPTRPDE